MPRPEEVTHFKELMERVQFFTLAELTPPAQSLSEMQKLSAFQIDCKNPSDDQDVNFRIYDLLNLLCPAVRDLEKLLQFPEISQEFVEFDKNPLGKLEAKKTLDSLVIKPPVEKVGDFSDWLAKIVSNKRPTAIDMCKMMGRYTSRDNKQSWHPASHDTYTSVRANYLDWKATPSDWIFDLRKLHSADLGRAALLVQIHFAKIHRLKVEWDAVHPELRCESKKIPCKKCATTICKDSKCAECKTLNENCTIFYERERAELKVNKQGFNDALLKLCDDYYRSPR